MKESRKADGRVSCGRYVETIDFRGGTVSLPYRHGFDNVRLLIVTLAGDVAVAKLVTDTKPGLIVFVGPS